MSFGLPLFSAGLVPRFKSSIRLRQTSGLRPTKIMGSGGKSRSAGKLGPAAILDQNPIFEMASKQKVWKLPIEGGIDCQW
jgi:hypothetical protein